MINREEAIKIANNIDYTCGPRPAAEAADILINQIYDSIGSCEECKFSTEHVNNKLIDCSRGYWSHTKKWYCADFEWIKKERK